MYSLNSNIVWLWVCVRFVVVFFVFLFRMANVHGPMNEIGHKICMIFVVVEKKNFFSLLRRIHFSLKMAQNWLWNVLENGAQFTISHLIGECTAHTMSLSSLNSVSGIFFNVFFCARLHMQFPFHSDGGERRLLFFSFIHFVCSSRTAHSKRFCVIFLHLRHTNTICRSHDVKKKQNKID